MAWESVSTGPGIRHVVPLGDLKPHELSDECWCLPREDAGDAIWVHNSMDRREDYETGRRRLN